MQYREISRTLGKYLLYYSLLLCVPLVVALYYQFLQTPQQNPQPNSSLEFFETAIICLLTASLFLFIGRKAKGFLYRRESIVLVALIWIVTAIISALPFYLTRTLENPLDAYFESMSGLTTTGASVICAKGYDASGKERYIEDKNIHVPEKVYRYKGTIRPVEADKIYIGVEAVSKAVLFWRSFIQWLGGMGIVVLFLAILPALAVGGKFLYQMEVPGPTKESLVPRIKETASILWKLYLALTILEIYLLIWTNPRMPLLDAFCITFSTLSTGGFTIRNGSIGAYNNFHTEWIVIIFMIIGSINFALYFHILKRKLYKIYEPDLLFFFGVAIIGALITSLGIIGTKQYFLDGTSGGPYHVIDAIRDGTFQAISAQTSTGFTTANFDMWPFAPQLFMLILMLFGGMAGSTAGGIKTSRFYILHKIITYKIESILRPETVRKLKVGGREISSSTSLTVAVFFCIAGFFIILGMTTLVIDGVDPESAISAAICMLHNIGISFRAGGPTQSFAFLSNFSKIVSTFLMLFGRLEYFAILLLFFPSFWKAK